MTTWTYDRTQDVDVATVGEWRVWVRENHDKRWDVTCDWGDTYRGAPTRSDAIAIAERFIAQRDGSYFGPRGEQG